jgi:hypothetical protein
MATTIPDLWPDDIKVEVLPPLAILKAQEGLLARKTQGKLQAKLTRTESERLVQYQLDLIAPSLNFYRELLLSARHKRGRYYPVDVTAECLTPKSLGPTRARGGGMQDDIDSPAVQQRATTDEEFIRLVREVLQSGEVRSLIHSLIARINESASEEERRGERGPLLQDRG